MISTTPYFRHLLNVLLIAIKKHQVIGIFYDTKHLDKNTAGEIKIKISKDFFPYYNVITFTDFVPGFITNPDGVSLFAGKPNFTFVIFLNFDYKSTHHRALLDELISVRIEYIIISPKDMDLVAFVPYMYMKLNLNNLNTLSIFRFYVTQFLRLNINSRLHYFRNLNNSLSCKLHESRVILNYFYLLSLFKSKKLFNKALAIYLWKKKTPKLPFSKFRSIKGIISLLSIKTKSKRAFFKYFFKEKYLKVLKRDQLKIKKLVRRHFRIILKKPRKYINIRYIKHYIKKFKAKKIKF